MQLNFEIVVLFLLNLSLITYSLSIDKIPDSVTPEDFIGDEAEDTFLGETSAVLSGEKPPTGGTGRVSPSVANDTHSLIVRLEIPTTRHKLRCEMFRNPRLIPVNFSAKFEGDNAGRSASSHKSLPCYFFGLATFDNLPFRSKCLFSFCEKVREGIVWLPGNEAHLKISLKDVVLSRNSDGHDEMVAAIFTRGNTNSFRVLEMPPNSFAFETAANEAWARRLLLDSLPSNWYHLRIMAIVTKEAFSSRLLNRDREKTIDFVSTVFNYVNVIYSTLNMSVYLTELVVWESNIPGVANMSDSDSWSSNGGLDLIEPLETIATEKLWPTFDKDTQVDHIVFIRNLAVSRYANRDLSILGLSYLNTICKKITAKGAARGGLLVVRSVHYTSFAASTIGLATVISHELGHALGAPDLTYKTKAQKSCRCTVSGRACVMSGSVDRYYPHVIQWEWSDCTIKQFAAEIYPNLPYMCLKHVPPLAPVTNVLNTQHGSQITQPVCGNGVIEPGEDCDCGPGSSAGRPPNNFVPVFCENPKCCNSATCKFAQNAKCVSGPCCIPATCSIAPKNMLCRSAKSECDLPEVCLGNSPYCPEDRYFQTGTNCTLKAGSCYKGHCISRDDHCHKIVGSGHELLENVAHCYIKNKQGGATNNCGHSAFVNDEARIVAKCNDNDVECGNIMCNLNPHLGKHRNVAIRSDKKMPCLSITGPRLPDIGHTPDGALCANGTRYCIGQQCIGKLSVCEQDLPCDNKGNHVENSTLFGYIEARPTKRPKFESNNALPSSPLPLLLAIFKACLLLTPTIFLD